MVRADIRDKDSDAFATPGALRSAVLNHLSLAGVSDSDIAHLGLWAESNLSKIESSGSVIDQHYRVHVFSECLTDVCLGLLPKYTPPAAVMLDDLRG